MFGSTRWCGSHFPHSHGSLSAPSKAVSTRTSCGARQAASWSISVLAHARPAAVAGDGEHADVVEPDDDRLAAQRRAAVDQLARLLQRLRLVLGERVHAEVELDFAIERHVAGPDAHMQEVAMVGAALPDVLALDQQRPQPGRLRVQAMQRATLELARLRQLTLALAQVLRVAARLLRRPFAHAALLRPAHPDREQQHQRQHSARHVEERGVAVHERVPDHAEAADHREQRLDDRGMWEPAAWAAQRSAVSPSARPADTREAVYGRSARPVLSLVSTDTTEAVPSRLRCLSALCRVPVIATSITEPREATPDAQHCCNPRAAAFHR